MCERSVSDHRGVRAPVAVVTGATDGIGRATALRLASTGWTVAVVGRNADRVASTAAEIAASTGRADAAYPITADLTSLAQTARVVDELRSWTSRLDLLILNANAIVQQRIVTTEGYEANLAIGLFSRALMARGLEDVLRATPDAQVVGVLGEGLTRFDITDAAFEREFSAMTAVGRWQWAWQLWTSGYAAQVPFAVNTYQPGLVRTKILMGDPRPEFRAQVQSLLDAQGVTPEDSALDLIGALNRAHQDRLSGGYLAPGAEPEVRALGEREGDREALDAFVHAAIGSYLPRP